MSYTFEVFRNQYPAVVSFVQHLAYYRGLKTAAGRLTNHKEFWAATTDGHLKIGTIAWCKVFGSRNEDLHWTKSPAGDIVDQAQSDFRNRVLSSTGFTKKKWETYHRNMLDFRNKYIAHFDLSNGPVPLFDPALQVAYAYQEWVRELIRPVILNQPTLYEQCRADAALCCQEDK